MRSLLILVASLGLAGCSSHTEQAARAPLTEHQRDSVLSRSTLPGASVVGRAMAESERAKRNAASVAATDSLFH